MPRFFLSLLFYMKIIILGSGAAVPTVDRGLSSLAVQVGREVLLLDCGEGTQTQLRKFKVKWGQINHIFISHLHGDHYFGLPGLLFTYHLYNRKKPLHLYAHSELKQLLENIFSISQSQLCYQTVFHEIEKDKNQVLIESNHFKVEGIPLTHRIPSTGFLMSTRTGDRRIKREFLDNYQPDRSLLPAIKRGANYANNSLTLLNQEITHDGKPAAKFAYLSDTAFQPSIIESIGGFQLVYHEATFASDQSEIAAMKGHTTAAQAAEIAKRAKVERLILGHLSSRIASIDNFLNEAKAIFTNTFVASDGDIYEI
ncbi:MAG: ribonuclease Z [Bacteroidales bacterium]|nr:ribonuclease Z [Bacteroidales bacterium]MDD3664697.1 ribonuclease Z [Bacteroidales bacterium]